VQVPEIPLKHPLSTFDLFLVDRILNARIKGGQFAAARTRRCVVQPAFPALDNPIVLPVATVGA